MDLFQTAIPEAGGIHFSDTELPISSYSALRALLLKAEGVQPNFCLKILPKLLIS